MMSELFGFIEWEKQQKKVILGGVTMYDIKGYYKYLNYSEIFDFWAQQSNL